MGVLAVSDSLIAVSSAKTAAEVYIDSRATRLWQWLASSTPQRESTDQNGYTPSLDCEGLLDHLAHLLGSTHIDV
jgi:hypothetical protein